MFRINGSVYTEGAQNLLPVDTLYNFKRYAVRFLINPDDVSNIITDTSPFKNAITANNILFDTTKYKYGKRSFLLNGTDSYIETPSNQIVAVNQVFTLSLWVNTQIYSKQNGICRKLFCLGNATNNIYVGLEDSASNASDKPCLFINNAIAVNNTTTAIADGNFHHIKITRNGNNELFFFIDGILIGSKITNTNPFGFLTNSRLTIGRHFSHAGHFSGNIDEVYLLNGLCENIDNFTPSPIRYFIPQESEEKYSGMTAPVKIYETVSKYDLLYYEPANRAFKIADIKDIKKLPIRGMALESGNKGDQIKMLVYGSIVSNSMDFPGSENEFTTLLPVLGSATDNTYNSVSVAATSGSPHLLLNAAKRTQQYTTANTYSQDTCQGGSKNWLRIKLNQPRYVASYSITGSATAANSPSAWALKGSNDRKTWVQLDYQSNITWSAGETKTFTTTNPNQTQYLYYELFDITMTNMVQLKLFDRFGIEVTPDFIGDYVYIYSSSNASSCDGWKVSDYDKTTYWSPASSQLNGILTFDFGYKYSENSFTPNVIDAITITCDNTNDGKRIYVPFKFTFDGSDDGQTWDTLATLNIATADQSPWTKYGDKIKFPFGKTVHYRYYRLNVLGSGLILSGGLPTVLKIPEVELLHDDINVLPLFTGQRALLGKSQSYIRVTDTDGYSETGYDAYEAFVSSTADTSAWYVAVNAAKPLPHNLMVEFNTATTITSFTLTSRNTTVRTTDPKDFALYGSNDNVTWDPLSAQTAVTWTQNQTKTFTLASAATYKFYKLQITAANSGTGTFVQQMQLFNGTTALVPTMPSAIYQTVGDSYFTHYMPQISIGADAKYDATTDACNLLNGNWLFTNTSGLAYQQWRTPADVLTGSISLILPDLSCTLYDRHIDGYVITTMVDNTNYDKFRYPVSWTLEGYNGTAWTTIDTITNSTAFNAPGQLKQFTLSQEYNNLTAIRLTITDTLGGQTVVPPNYFGLSEFYPTYKGVKLEIPRFPSNVSAKRLNKYVVYNSVESWELEYSSSDNTTWTNNAVNVFNRDTSTSWVVSQSESAGSQITGAFGYAKSAITIGLKTPKRLHSYGVFISPITMCGNGYSAINWNFYGSNDGVTWDLLHSVNPVTTDMVLNSWPMIFTLSTTKSYMMYKFDDMNGGQLHGVEFYESNNIRKSAQLTASITDPGKLSTVTNTTLYNTENIYNNVQVIGYTGLTFATADEEYSVKYFDFDKQITPSNPSQGNVNITASTNIGHSIVNGPMVTYLCDSLNIKNGQTLSTNVKCRGLRIIVKGDCVIDGTLSMTGKGTNYSPLWMDDFPILDDYGKILGYIPRFGSLGGRTRAITSADRLSNMWISTNQNDGTRQYGLVGVDGIDGVNRGTAGGGSGSSCSFNAAGFAKAGDGGRGSCFSGGVGGGAHYDYTANANNMIAGMPGLNDGCLAGYSISTVAYQYGATGVGAAVNTSGPGAGPISGSGIYSGSTGASTGVSGAGGTIILIVYGNLYINLLGSIESKGSFLAPVGNVAGGASGGGSINIFYGGLFIKNGTITAAGGTSTSTIRSGNGGNGSVTINKL